MASDNVYATLYNADSVPFTNGMVLRISANQRAVRARADSAPHVQGLVGVNGSGVVGIGGPANVVGSSVRQKVLCEAGLTPVAGQTLYVSDVTAGLATNVAPALATAIGTIEDVGSYAQDSRVFATVSIPGTTTSGSVFPGFGTAPPAWGPTTAGTTGLASDAGHTHPSPSVANVAALALLSAATMDAGTYCYVVTLKCWFKLEPSTQATATYVRYTALGKAGYLWIRDSLSPAWWSQLTWYFTSSALANDEADGASALTPISPQEWFRRTKFRWLPGTETASVTINLTADLGDNDYIQCNWTNGLRGGAANLSINGFQTVQATGLITVAVAPNRATNATNDITAGFSWATHVGRHIRLQGTTTTTAGVMKDLGGNAARLGEQCVTFSTGAGFTNGQTIEVVTMAKVPGIHILSGPNVVLCNDVSFDAATLRSLRGDSCLSNFTFTRCQFKGGASGGSIAALSNLGFVACVFHLRQWNVRCSTWGLNCCTQVNQAAQGLTFVAGTLAENTFTSHMSQASSLSFGENTYVHLSGGGSGNMGFCDLGAGQVGLNMFNRCHLDIAAMWGPGNDATAVQIQLQTAASFSRAAGASAFTVAGGVGLRMALGGVAFDIPLTQLPHSLSGGTQPGNTSHVTGKLTTGVGAVFTYASCSDAPVANSATRWGYATSERLAMRLRSRVVSGAVGVTTTLLVYKNGAATGMTVTIPAGAAVSTKAVDSAHPTLFADGDDWDVRADAPIDGVTPGDLQFSSEIEWAT